MEGAWVADCVEHSSLLTCPRWICEEEIEVIFKGSLWLRPSGIAFIAALLFTQNNPGVKAISGALPLPVHALCVFAVPSHSPGPSGAMHVFSSGVFPSCSWLVGHRSPESCCTYFQ